MADRPVTTMPTAYLFAKASELGAWAVALPPGNVATNDRAVQRMRELAEAIIGEVDKWQGT